MKLYLTLFPQHYNLTLLSRLEIIGAEKARI